MAEISLSVPEYDPAIGVTVTVEIANESVEIFGDPAGLRDLARMCLALETRRRQTARTFTSIPVSTRLISVPPRSCLPAIQHRRIRSSYLRHESVIGQAVPARPLVPHSKS
jgi:hypothetical protein